MSVLKWESNDENDYVWAETMQGEYMVCELNGGGWDCMFRDWQLDSKIYETKQAAMDACEADYISRCTERLELVRPGNVQIPAEMFAKLAESWCGVCEEEGLGDCKTCDLHALKNGLPIVPTRILADDEAAVKRETAERLCVMSDIPAVYGYGPVAKDLAHLARANGYVKLQPGQVVVDVKHLEFARVWFLVFRKTRIDWTIEADHDADRAFAAAVNAAKENRDAR